MQLISHFRARLPAVAMTERRDPMHEVQATMRSVTRAVTSVAGVERDDP